MRMIDADALKKDVARLHVLNDEAEIRRAYEYNPHVTSTDFEETLVSVFDAIDDAPTIEPKRGEWKPFDLTWGRSIWYCTACEESTEVPCDIWEHKPIYKYCPNCGAQMKGADDGTR